MPFISDVSQTEFADNELVSSGDIREPLFSYIKKSHPDFDNNKKIALSELNDFRENYVCHYVSKSSRKLSELENSVLESLNSEKSLVNEVESEPAVNTFGQKIADKVAEFGGSWTFIISFLSFLVVWMLVNVFILTANKFDPYPFILLNLMLSCVAALQAPIIMMSQKRQEEKDRDRAKKDYMINLKSELEIRMLHEKLDHLIQHQQHELIRIQRIQVEMMNDILKSNNANAVGNLK